MKRLAHIVARVAATAALLGLGTAVAALLVLRVTGDSADVVLSGSMHPSLEPGDVAILARVPDASLRVGDVIAYLPPGATVPRIHRLISITSTSNGLEVETRGDANQMADVPVLLKGSETYRLVGTVPLVGWLWNSRAALWIGAGALLLLLTAGALWQEVRPGR
jgi:signal peptidase